MINFSYSLSFLLFFTIGASTLLPLLFDNEATTTDVYILLSIFFVSSGFLLWNSFSFYSSHPHFLQTDLPLLHLQPIIQINKLKMVNYVTINLYILWRVHSEKAIIVLSILYLILTVHTGAVLLGKEDYRSAINTLKETKEVSSFQSAKDGVILLKGALTTAQPITEEKLQNKEFALLEINTYKRRKANWINIDTEQHIAKRLLLNNEVLPALKEIRFSMEPITLSGKDISIEDYSLKRMVLN